MARISIVAPRHPVVLLVFAILGTYSIQRIVATELVVPECPPFQGSNSSYWFIASIPSNCKNNPETCSYYIAVRRNPRNGMFADFHLQATAKGYVAVGFSKDTLMEDDDVIGCKRDPETGNISVVNAWNPSPRHASNVRNPNQHGVCPFKTDYSNGKISCKFSRYILPINASYDYNLDGAYFLFLATSEKGGSPHFHKHTTIPAITDTPTNVFIANTSAVNNNHSPLVKAHGAVMLLTWPLLVLIAVFTASWMRPAMKKDYWFQIHRAFNITAVVSMVIGIILVIVANKDNNPPGLITFDCGAKVAHTLIGLVVLLMIVANPILGFLRPPVNSAWRRLFNIIHGLGIGYGALILAVVNVGLGLVLFQTGCGPTSGQQNSMLVVYAVFVLFVIIVEVVLIVTFTCMALRLPVPERATIGPTMLRTIFPVNEDYENVVDEDEQEEEEEKQRLDWPWPQAHKCNTSLILRWVSFIAMLLACVGIFVLLTILITTAT